MLRIDDSVTTAPGRDKGLFAVAFDTLPARPHAFIPNTFQDVLFDPHEYFSLFW
jgi:hypothetical protein